MIHSKSIQVLKTLSEEELKQFSDFVRSPFFNKNKNLIKLFDVLEKYHPGYEIENEKVYSKIYSGKEYNHNNMKKLMSEMFLIIEMFLSHIKLKKEKFTSEKYLLEEYTQRRLNELFLYKVKKMNEQMEEVNYYTYGGFFHKYDYENLIIQFYFENNLRNKIPMDHIIKRSEYSLCCFLNNMLDDINNIDVFRGIGTNILKETLTIELFSKSWDMKIFLKYLSDSKIKNNFIVFQINLVLMLIYPKNETYFKQAKLFLLSNSNNLDKGNYIRFWEYYSVYLQNYCEDMISRKRKRKYELELFEIFKHHLKIIVDNINKITSSLFLNIIIRGLRLNELKWVEEFMKYNTEYLEEKDKENTYNYARGELEFAKRNYEESLNYASKLTIRTSYYYKIDVNITILRCHYELSLFDAAFSLIDSNKHYISKTEEMTFEDRESYRRILSILYKLFKLKTNLNDIVKSDLLNLKSEIINAMTYPDWYLQKVEDLEKSISVKTLQGKLNQKSHGKKRLEIA